METWEMSECYDDPWLLDTPEKVEWALDIWRNHHFYGKAPWKLGDHCWYRPLTTPA